MLGDFGIDGHKHFVCSSHAHRAQTNKRPLPTSAGAQEYGASGLAIVMLLAHWSVWRKQISEENNKDRRGTLTANQHAHPRRQCV